MAQPTPYSPSHEFLTDELQLPTLPGSELDIEFNAIETTLSGLRTNLALIQSDSGGLKNGVVTRDSLSPSMEAVWVTGERYDLIFAITGDLLDGEELPAVSIPVPLTLDANLPFSLAHCDTAPASDAVFTFKRKTGAGPWTSVFTVTFPAGQTAGVFSLPAGLALAIGDRLRPVAPSPPDVSLTGFSATIFAVR